MKLQKDRTVFDGDSTALQAYKLTYIQEGEDMYVIGYVMQIEKDTVSIRKITTKDDVILINITAERKKITVLDNLIPQTRDIF